MGTLFLSPMFLMDRSPKWEWGVVLCGIACGILYAISKTVILKGYEKTTVAFMTLCHSAGMILPCILGYFFWSEKLSILSVIGIFLAVVSIVLLKDTKPEKKSVEPYGILIGILVFLSSGGVMIIQKLMGIYFSEQSTAAYNFYSFVVAFLILCLFIRPMQNDQSNRKATLLCAIGSAISLCIISLVMTNLAGAVPSAILFPLFNGSGIICVCIGSVFAFKEPLGIKKIVGLLLGVCGLCLVNF